MYVGAASEISGLIAEIQAERIGAAGEDIAGRVTRIAGAVQEISGQADRMQAGIGEVASVAEESSAAAEQARTAETLDQLARQFKVAA